MGKLSKTQMEVLRLMSQGWELGHTSGFNPRWWLQKGGLGRGGESKDVRSATFFSLQEKKLVGLGFIKWPVTHYELTEAGKEAAGGLTMTEKKLTPKQAEILEMMRDKDAWILAREGRPLKLMEKDGRIIKSIPRKTFEELRSLLNSTTRRTGDVVYTIKAGTKIEEDNDANR